MSQAISERTTAFLARSLPMVRQHKAEIVVRMEMSLRDVAPEPGDRAELIARTLLGLLIAQAAGLVDGGRPAGLESAARELRSLEIGGRHYSRFGDALVPILKDVLGGATPRQVASAWCDTFWLMVEALGPTEETAASN